MNTKTPFPTFATDDEYDEWLQSANLSEYDVSNAAPAKGFFAKWAKDASIHLRLPALALEQLHAKSERGGKS